MAITPSVTSHNMTTKHNMSYYHKLDCGSYCRKITYYVCAMSSYSISHNHNHYRNIIVHITIRILGLA